MRLYKIVALFVLPCSMANLSLTRASEPNSKAKVQKLDAAALAQLIDDHIEKRCRGFARSRFTMRGIRSSAMHSRAVGHWRRCGRQRGIRMWR